MIHVVITGIYRPSERLRIYCAEISITHLTLQHAYGFPSLHQQPFGTFDDAEVLGKARHSSNTARNIYQVNLACQLPSTKQQSLVKHQLQSLLEHNIVNLVVSFLLLKLS